MLSCGSRCTDAALHAQLRPKYQLTMHDLVMLIPIAVAAAHQPHGDERDMF